MAGKHKRYTPDETQALFEIKGWQVRPLVCYDLRFPVWSRTSAPSRTSAAALPAHLDADGFELKR